MMEGTWSVVTNIVCVDDVAAGEIHILSTQKIDSVVILVRQWCHACIHDTTATCDYSGKMYTGERVS
jgi:hypothetical protein